MARIKLSALSDCVEVGKFGKYAANECSSVQLCLPSSSRSGGHSMAEVVLPGATVPPVGTEAVFGALALPEAANMFRIASALLLQAGSAQSGAGMMASGKCRARPRKAWRCVQGGRVCDALV